MSVRNLHVNIRKANLISNIRDFTGSGADLYASLHLGDFTHKTAYDEDSGAYPNWNAWVDVPFFSDTENIDVKVWDWDTWGRDEAGGTFPFSV